MIAFEIKPKEDMGVPMQRNLRTKLKCKQEKHTSQQNLMPPAPNIVENKKRVLLHHVLNSPQPKKLDMVLDALAGAQQEIHNLKQKVEAKEKQLCFQVKK